MWEVLRRDLHSNDVTTDMIEDKKEERVKIFRGTSVGSTESGANDKDAVQGRKGQSYCNRQLKKAMSKVSNLCLAGAQV